MANVINVIYDKLYGYRFFIFIIFSIILFSIVGFFLYNRVIKPLYISKTKGYDDIANRPKNDNTDIEIIYFFASWCPHCQKCAPEWKQFKTNYNNKEKNGRNIYCKEVDCTRLYVDEDDTTEIIAIKDEIAKYKVDGFPTIKIIIDEKIIDFDARINNENLEAFINSM